MEENPFYGDTTASHPLHQFVQIMGEEAIKENQDTSPTLPSLPANTRSIKLPRHPIITGDHKQQFYKELETQEEASSAPEIETTENTEESADQSETVAPPEPTPSVEEILMKDSRRYNIDMTSNLIWARGKDIKVLVRAGTHRYLEFQCLRKTLYYQANKNRFIVAPVTKKDIFRTKDISLVEKRSLMRFVTNVMKQLQTSASSETTAEQDEADDQATNEEEEENVASQAETFVEYMKEQKLTENLQNYILYIVCLCASVEEANGLSVEEGVQRVAKYQQSSGVYGDTPFLYPLYGVSEINQAYSRLGAVHGAYFILSRAMDSLVVDGESGKIRGVVCSAGQFLEAPVVIMPTRFFPGATRSPQSSRFVAITEESLSSDDKLFHMIMPPTTAEDRTTQTVFLTQLDGSTYTCPRDRYVVHATSVAQQSPEEDLQRSVQQVLRLSETEDAKKPKALYSAFWTSYQYSAPDDAVLPDGLCLSPDLPPTQLGFESHLDWAENQFKRIIPLLPSKDESTEEGEAQPEYEFFPERPDPNERAELDESDDI